MLNSHFLTPLHRGASKMSPPQGNLAECPCEMPKRPVHDSSDTPIYIYIYSGRLLLEFVFHCFFPFSAPSDSSSFLILRRIFSIPTSTLLLKIRKISFLCLESGTGSGRSVIFSVFHCVWPRLCTVCLRTDILYAKHFVASNQVKKEMINCWQIRWSNRYLLSLTDHRKY